MQTDQVDAQGGCRPNGNCTTHEWGLRGPAWVDTHTFTDDVAFVDLNITRAVQVSQSPNIRSYHRRVFANWADVSYLLWDDIDAPASVCARARSNLHAVTELGVDGHVGCAVVGSAAGHALSVRCNSLRNATLDVTVLRPVNASARGLLTMKADPLSIQFTGMLGVPLGQSGGAFAGDWVRGPQHSMT
jgi:hypothetical protein